MARLQMETTLAVLDQRCRYLDWYGFGTRLSCNAMENPYSPPLTTDPQQSIRLGVRDYRVFGRAFAVLFFVGMFIPTIELFKGNISMGRAPVWLGYVGIFMSEYWGIAIPVVAGHLVTVLVLTWLSTLIFQGK